MTAPDRDPRDPSNAADGDADIGRRKRPLKRPRSDDFTQAAAALRARARAAPSMRAPGANSSTCGRAPAPALERAAAAPPQANVLAFRRAPGAGHFSAARWRSAWLFWPCVRRWGPAIAAGVERRLPHGHEQRASVSQQMTVQMNTQTRIDVRAPVLSNCWAGEAEILASGARQPVSVVEWAPAGAVGPLQRAPHGRQLRGHLPGSAVQVQGNSTG